MAKGEKDLPELVRTAQALESDLVRFEELSRAVRKIRLDSDKSLSRAVKELNDALAQPERLAEGLRQLAHAMERMQLRQQAALEPLAERATEIQQRMNLLAEYMEKYGALGKAAGSVTELLQSDGEQSGAVLMEVDERLTRIVDDARALSESARADDFPEISRGADALKQRIAALRGRLRPN
jgi:chromosome segregation ATPase